MTLPKRTLAPPELLYLRCACFEPHHCWVVERDEDFPDTFTIQFVAESNGNFWHRVRYALRHVFKRDMLVMSDMILKPEDSVRLAEFITPPTGAA